MPTILTAGDAVSAASSFAGANDGALNIVVGPAGGKLTALSIDAAGQIALPTNTTNKLVAAAGTAPVYGCRAWANFNGTTATIRASGNIASVVRNGTGDYTVTFTTAMPDADYAALVSCQSSGSAVVVPMMFNSVVGGPSIAQTAPTASALRITVWSGGATPTDSNIVLLSVFR